MAAEATNLPGGTSFRVRNATATLPLRRRSPTETFNWHVKPEQLPVVGGVYPDGSARDGPMPELERLGWAFAILDKAGRVVASAYGVPPPWITNIEGAEA